MVIRELTERLIDEGAKLIARLDESGARVSAAMWVLHPSAEKWKLVIAMPVVAREGPRKGYQLVQKALASLGENVQDLVLWDTVVQSPDAPLVVRLRKALRTGPGLSRVWLRGSGIGSEMLPDSLIYRAA